MPLFDAYVMVDWSGRNGRCGGKQDCIWIAHGRATARTPRTMSPRSRTDAERAIRSLIEPVARSRKGRVLLCADFGYGYPAGFASLLPEPRSAGTPAWRAVWEYLAKRLRDDIGTPPGGNSTNRSNRFEVASAINARASRRSSRGPFWCLSRAGAYRCIPQTQPPRPFACSGGRSIEPLRITDKIAQSSTPFRLFGTGSVGSQILTGVPRLHAIRFDPQFADCSAVWPFETGWAPARGRWLDPGLRVLHAEIYPSVRRPLQDSIKDRGQVRAMWHWARRLDAKDLLRSELGIPPGITRRSGENLAIRREEGWILGCPRRPAGVRG